MSTQLSPLVLAFVGDSVFDLFVRSRLVMKRKESAHRMHVKAINYVRASAQSRIVSELYDRLNDDEKIIFRRGKKLKIGHRSEACRCFGLPQGNCL